MKKILLIVAMILLTVITTQAQRPMDKLDRGLVAVKVSNGVFCSWRIPGEEWYDVKYNLYRDGTLVNATPLNVSNYTDIAGTLTSTYSVKAVKNGVEQSASKQVSVLGDQYIQIDLPDVMIPMIGKNQHKATNLFGPNDISVADLDGDGEYEIILKRVNNDFTMANDTAFTRFEAYKINGKKMWQVDCGPNMVSGSNVEVDMVAYDWDGDGKAEVVFRCQDMAQLNDGTWIGDSTASYRSSVLQSANMTYMTKGPEYLVMLDGETGKLLDKINFPLPRGEASDWGDGYGHRANKFFFGSPFLDGRHPSLFLARGIYTKTICCAYDIVNKKFSKRWANLTDFITPDSPWFGQGYHNYCIADVDDDGKDEMVYGSMVIDDNGKGLYTTGLGHGDAQHCGDFDPYHKGLEIWTCHEAQPGVTFREAGTGKILYRKLAGGDVGRCMAANVSNDYDGAALQGMGNLKATSLTEDTKFPGGVTVNFCMYWDGDLLQETFDYQNNPDGEPSVFKYGSWNPLFQTKGCLTNNGTKGNPCFMGDILGDWRDEFIVRTSNDRAIRIYTTTTSTSNRIYTQLHDLEYRNAMTWQMCGYNQPAHDSYYLGEREGILTPPPPVMTNDRTEETTTITTADNDKHVILCQMNGGSVNVSNGANPYILTVNSPKDYSLTGATFSGNTMRMVKQGCGNLTLSGTHTYGGETNVWDGTLTLNGTISNSSVWLNRFAEMNLSGEITKTLNEEYGSILHVGGDSTISNAIIGKLILKRGSVIKMDITSDETSTTKNDLITIKDSFSVRKGAVISIIQNNKTGVTIPAPGDYPLLKAHSLNSNIVDSLTLDNTNGTGAKLKVENNTLYLSIPKTRNGGSELTWTGSNNAKWNVIDDQNFTNNGIQDMFISGDKVIFDDNGANNNITINGAVTPSSIEFDNNSKNYSFTGDSITGNTSITKNGTGYVNLNNINHFNGITTINNGALFINTCANKLGQYYGSLGDKNNKIYLNGGTLGVSATNQLYFANSITLQENGGCINAKSSITLENAINGHYDLVKKGNGILGLGANNHFRNLYINEGSVYDAADGHAYGDTVIFNGKGVTLEEMNSTGSYSLTSTNLNVPAGCSGIYYIDGRSENRTKLTGAGTLDVYMRWYRNNITGDWSNFSGTLNAHTIESGGFTLSNSYGMPHATFNVTANTNVDNTGNNFSFGKLTGSGQIGGTGTYTIGALGENFTYSGVISGSNVIKTGAGIWTIGSNQSQTTIGTISVTDGTLYLNNSTATSTMTGTNDIYVGGTGTLAGRGYCENANININNGGTLKPGLITTKNPIGCITMTGNLTTAKGSNIELNVFNNKNYASSRSYLKVGGKLTLNGNLNVSFYTSSISTYTPSAGDSIVLWTAKSFAGTPILNFPALPDELVWDTSDLLKPTGILRITTTSGVTAISDNEKVDCAIYTMSGIKVANFRCTKNEATSRLNETPLKSGTYIIRLRGAKYCETKKITFR